MCCYCCCWTSGLWIWRLFPHEVVVFQPFLGTPGTYDIVDKQVNIDPPLVTNRPLPSFTLPITNSLPNYLSINISSFPPPFIYFLWWSRSTWSTEVFYCTTPMFSSLQVTRYGPRYWTYMCLSRSWTNNDLPPPPRHPTIFLKLCLHPLFPFALLQPEFFQHLGS